MEFLTPLALGAAALAVALASAAALGVRRSRREIESLGARLDALERDAREMERDLVARIAREATSTPGTRPVVRPANTIGEVLALHPNAQEILARFHIGGCASCAVSERETLEAAARGHGVELPALLAALNSPQESACASAMPSQHWHVR